MFTGLVDDVGTIESAHGTDAGIEIRIGSMYRDLDAGESIAVNGACLTVRDCGPRWFTAAAVITTVGRTTIGDWRPGRRVNLERAMKASGRFGGHIVQGHVDDVGTVIATKVVADATLIDIVVPTSISETLVPLGSVTVDGVSLTVNAITGDVLQVSLVEYTLHHTALGQLAEGSRVHLESDVIGKYVRQLMVPYLNRQPA